MKIEIEKPASRLVAAQHRGRQLLHVSRDDDALAHLLCSKCGFSLFKKGSATLTLGEHPRVQPLKGLDIESEPSHDCIFA